MSSKNNTLKSFRKIFGFFLFFFVKAHSTPPDFVPTIFKDMSIWRNNSLESFLTLLNFRI